MPASTSAAAPDAPDRASVGGDDITFRVTSDASDGTLLAFDVRMAPGGGPPALHRHDRFELYRVDRGGLTFYMEDDRAEMRRSVAGPGTLVAIPSGREHTVRNESPDEARALALFSHGVGMTRPLEAIA